MSDGSITIVKTESSAGAWQEAQKKALWSPAAKALDLSFRLDTCQSWADARVQVDSGSVTWDIIQIALAEIPQAKAAGILEKLDPDICNEADFVPGSFTDYFVGNSLYSTVIAWNKKKFGEEAPRSKADFWDVLNFPGKRALWSEPVGMIEAAALASGASRDTVYAFLSTAKGRNAALDKLAEIVPYVSVWWQSGAQASQLIMGGEVDMILTWNGRVQDAIDEGANFAYTFNDGQLGIDGYAIVKGAPNRDAAMRFLKEVSKPDYQKDLPNCFPTAPANMKALQIGGYSAEKIATMASAPQNVPLQYAANSEFWAQHGVWVYEAYGKLACARRSSPHC
jgi:putative spermidine/putrescine transport system substrate-binding protein